jgi:hypothetical protein
MVCSLAAPVSAETIRFDAERESERKRERQRERERKK